MKFIRDVIFIILSIIILGFITLFTGVNHPREFVVGIIIGFTVMVGISIAYSIAYSVKEREDDIRERENANKWNETWEKRLHQKGDEDNDRT